MLSLLRIYERRWMKRGKVEEGEEYRKESGVLSLLSVSPRPESAVRNARPSCSAACPAVAAVTSIL